MIEYIAISIIRFSIKFFLCYVCSWLDGKFYYEQKQEKLDKGLQVNWFIKFLFKPFNYKGRTSVPIYRVLQKIWEITCLLLILYLVIFVFQLSLFVIIIEILSILAAIYFMILERQFYMIFDVKGLKQIEQDVKDNKYDVWWLKPEELYFAGTWMFKPFTIQKFDKAYKIAFWILLISSFFTW